MKRPPAPQILALLLAITWLPAMASAKEASPASTYQGWETLRLANPLIELQILPEIGGRIIQFKLGDREFLWVNPQLAGKFPEPSGLNAEGGWFNIGGDKLWPAPQGWDNDQQWPGPPDAVLDGQPYECETLAPGQPGEMAVRLTSRDDPRSGIRFSRVIRIFPGSTRVAFEVTMKNIDTKPRRWGIWSHTQLDGANADRSSFNPLLQAWCPINPKSRFPRGYQVMFGEQDNSSFEADKERGLVHVRYQYKVGKIGIDSPAGWSATVNGETGAVFVQRFVFEADKPYPDESSVEFWLNGTGRIHAYNKDIVMPENTVENPYMFESEILSPFAALKPGQSYSWRYDWYATQIGGDFPVLDCSDIGVTAEPLRAKIEGGKTHLTGRFGVFAPGTVRAEFSDARGTLLASHDLSLAASPLQAFVIKNTLDTPASATSVKLLWIGADRKTKGPLAQAKLTDK
jgi:hypothetical protein